MCPTFTSTLSAGTQAPQGSIGGRRSTSGRLLPEVRKGRSLNAPKSCESTWSPIDNGPGMPSNSIEPARPAKRQPFARYQPSAG